MRINDFFITIPAIILGSVIGYHFGNKGVIFLAFFLGLLLWGQLSRLVRGEFLTLREREFVDAARVAGASNRRIIFKHILPNAVGVIIVSVTLLMSGAILLEAALSYLGFGVVAPDVSLGLLISQYQDSFTTRPWLFWYPGLLIVIIALCVNFIGDGLRDAFDPRQRRRLSRKDRAAERSAAVLKKP
ncbi:MAG: ABC transporter permease [Actinomycetota bacterium]